VKRHIAIDLRVQVRQFEDFEIPTPVIERHGFPESESYVDSFLDRGPYFPA